MTTIYVRKFDAPAHVKTDTSEYRVSRYFPRSMVEGLKKALQGSFIREDDYIIGPIYSAGDFQIGMTGKMEEKETAHQAVQREMGEEIGLVPKSKSGLTGLISWKSKEGVTFNVFNIYIKDCTPVLEEQNHSQGPDSKNKVGCYVYGSKQDVLKFLDSHIYRYKSGDDIVGLAAIKADDIFRTRF